MLVQKITAVYPDSILIYQPIKPFEIDVLNFIRVFFMVFMFTLSCDGWASLFESLDQRFL
jgi:hypothetical protein